MSEILSLTTAMGREELTDQFGGSEPFRYCENWPLSSRRLPELGTGEVRFGRWVGDGEADLPQVVVTRAGEQRNFLAWIGTYFESLAPLTQWCRLVTNEHLVLGGQRQATSMDSLQAHVWANVVLGECFAQMREPGDIGRLPLAAALSCQSFVFARALSVWGDLLDPREAMWRWAEFRSSLGYTGRRLSPERIATVCSVVQSVFRSHERAGNGEADDELVVALQAVAASGGIPLDLWSRLGQHVGAPRLSPLPDGSQQERLRAFDSLINSLGDGRTIVGDFVAGVTASSVTNGRLQNIDLLKPVLERFPTAPLWYALHAALLGRTAIGAEFDGFGRQIAKEIRSRFDLTEAPRSDVSIDELAILLPGQDYQWPSIRGFSRSLLLVELIPGVDAAWSMGGRETDALHQSFASEKKREAERMANVTHAIAEAHEAIDRLHRQVSSSLGEQEYPSRGGRGDGKRRRKSSPDDRLL